MLQFDNFRATPKVGNEAWHPGTLVGAEDRAGPEALKESSKSAWMTTFCILFILLSFPFCLLSLPAALTHYRDQARLRRHRLHIIATSAAFPFCIPASEAESVCGCQTQRGTGQLQTDVHGWRRQRWTSTFGQQKEATPLSPRMLHGSQQYICCIRNI